MTNKGVKKVKEVNISEYLKHWVLFILYSQTEIFGAATGKKET